jgi:hypothetical protein
MLILSIIPVNPVFNFHSRHQAEMFDVVCYDSQAMVQSRSPNKDVKTTYA